MRLNSDVLGRVTFLTGSAGIAERLPDVPAFVPFDGRVMDFLDDVSKALMKDPRSKGYPDVVTFAFWIRKANVQKLKERFKREELRVGKGVVFHIAPSNVPVNFAYSLAAGLLTGNANIVRVPGKEFPQVDIITEAMNRVLTKHEKMKAYVLCVRYGRDREINDLFSSVADERIVWGGDRTVAELRKSPLPPRSGEITFADRYSLAVIDSDYYLAVQDKARVAEDFYNDTFLTDQNACTAPFLVAWTGSRIDAAKEVFWRELHGIAARRYTLRPIQAVNKLAKGYLAAAALDVKMEPHIDNLIVRVKVPEITKELTDYRDNGGYFYEYDCGDILDLVPLCDDKRCQTVSYIGEKGMILPLLTAGVKGIDRVVPAGRTMEFDLVWDGYDLPAYLSRVVGVE